MKNLILICAMVFAAPLAFGEQTVGEKVEAKGHDAKRSMKKTGHRMSEAACGKGDTKCMEEKAKHRGQEGTDYVKDKAVETKDKVD